MPRSAASAELTRQVEKSTPAAYERVSKDDAHLGFFHSSLSRRSSLRHRALIKWLVPEPSRTRGLISALVRRPFPLPPSSRHSGPWVIGSLRPSVFYVFLRRYGRRSGQPSSSSLARRACVHIAVFVSRYCCSRVQVFLELVYRDILKFRKRSWPLRGSRGDGNGGRFVRSPCLPSWRGFAPLRCTSDAVTLTFVSLCSLYSSSPLSSRPQPLESGGDVAPCEDTREDFGLSV